MKMQSAWYNKIEKIVEEQKKDLSENDQKFYHIDRFLKVSEQTEKLSDNCSFCKENKILVEELSSSISNNINSPGRDRRKFEKQFTLVLKHLRNYHAMYPIRYYVSLYTFWGLVIGGSSGYLISYIISDNLKWKASYHLYKG
ncbi:hypothetical protein ACFLSY_11540 [Bacteroidota bacterium]